MLASMKTTSTRSSTTFERLGTLESGKLGPAHAALDGRFDYGVLKCLLAELS